MKDSRYGFLPNSSLRSFIMAGPFAEKAGSLDTAIEMNRAFSVRESFTVKRVFVRLLCSLPILTWMTSVNAIALLASSSGQKSSFSANWICRERAEPVVVRFTFRDS